jgi:hypothetical protein
VHARDEASAAEAARRVVGALTVVDTAVQAPTLVHAWLGEGVQA